jgi:predicted nucleic acid-binding protein
MSEIVVLDSNVLGLISNPKVSAEAMACKDWLDDLLGRETTVGIPEIVDYELRRELIRANKLLGLRSLDAFKVRFLYVPITTEMMLLAAQIWAQTRQGGIHMASGNSLDADVILAAQSLITAEKLNLDLTIATTNVRHLGRIAPAKDWRHWL